MKFNLKELNPPTKFYFDENNHDEGFVEIRILPIRESRKIAKKTTSKKNTFKRGKLIPTEDINQDLSDRLTWDYCIVSWEKVIDENGNDIQCSTDNKLLLMNNSPVFSSFVAESLSVLSQLEIDMEEEEEKN